MRKLIFASILTALTAYGEIPTGYYTSLSGKSGEALKEAVKTVSFPADFSRVSYGPKTWEAFMKTDVRVINGVEVWWDMYSNFANPVSGHESMNIEHSVANSWFGAKKGCEDAYSDLFHLNPSDQDANNHKSNWPLGEVATASWENGLVKLGKPATGTAGSATTVFEPADEYKGDFARAYFYIFTTYDTAPWIADQPMYNFETSVSLEPWAVEMLCRWAKEDPVDSKEINRNEEIYKIQKNRNPFIDYPELIDHIWGDKKTEAFTPGDGVTAVDRPAEPVFTGCRIVGVNNYSSRWWDKNTFAVKHEEGDLWVSVNGGDYEQYGPGVSVPAASAHGAVHTLSAYTAAEYNGKTLRSPIATLNLTARDPEKDDYTEAMYVPVATQADFQPDNDTYYVLRSASNGHIMGYQGGTSSTKFLPDAGTITFASTDADNDVEGLPTDAAILKFKPTEGGKYLIEVSDALHHNMKGYMNFSGTKTALMLNNTTGTAANVTISNGEAVISFDNGSTLQYNKSQPRFTNYTSSQGAVKLARFSKFLDIASGLKEQIEEEEGVAIDGHNIYLPAGWSLYDLQGRKSTGRDLAGGIYIARSKKGKTVKIMIQQ